MKDTHPHKQLEYVKWMAEVFQKNEARNIDEVCAASKKERELLLTPFPAVGRNGPRPGY